MAKPYIDLDLTRLVGVDPQRLLEQILGDVREAIVAVAEQQTRRQEIAARERVALTDLADRRALFMTYLERSFDERRALFARLFEQVDRALDQRDVGALQATLAAVSALATSSPFRDLASLDATRAALKRNEPWEL